VAGAIVLVALVAAAHLRPPSAGRDPEPPDGD